MRIKAKFISVILIIATIISLTLIPISAESAVASIGNVTYSSLPEAFAAAKNGDTIKLLTDVSVNTSGSAGRIRCFSAGINVTLDGNGHTVSSVADVTLAFHHDSALDTDNGQIARITVKNLTVINTSNSSYGTALQVNAETVLNVSNCKLYSNGINPVGVAIVQSNASAIFSESTLIQSNVGPALRVNGSSAKAHVYNATLSAEYILDSGSAPQTAIFGYGANLTFTKAFFTDNAAGVDVTIAGASVNTDITNAPLISTSKANLTVNVLSGSFNGGTMIFENKNDSQKSIAYPSTDKRASFGLSTKTAGIKFAENSSGLRFTSTISADLVKLLESQSDGKVLEIGTIICPADYLSMTGGVIEASALNSLNTSSSDNYLRIKASNGLKKSSNGSITVSAALVNIKTKNYNRDFAAAAYVATIENGVKKYTYASPAITNVRLEAQKALSNVSKTKTNQHQTKLSYYFVSSQNGYSKVNEDAFTKYSRAQVNVLENYLNGIINFKENQSGGAMKESTLKISQHTSDVFRTVGRTYTRNGNLVCDFSCTGIRFNAYCRGNVYITLNTTADIYFTVFVDGERQSGRVFANNASASRILIAENLPIGNHEIEIVKQSQFNMSRAELKEITIFGEFKQIPKQRELFFEFYGDSILNGSNIHLGGTSVKTSDASLAFGWLTAQKLGADCNIIGVGGLGIEALGGLGFTVGDIYDLNGARDSAGVTKYSFSRKPDAVILELGVNDQAKNVNASTYKTKATQFINNIRAKYGDDVPIIWLNGYHDKNFWSNTQAVINNFGGESANIYVCNLSKAYLTSAQGGDGWHPDVAMSQTMANELSTYIKSLLNLT